MSNFSDMDLVLCHNVLIYFSKEQIKKSIQQFTKTLALHGWLSVGAIEAPFVNHEELSPHEFSGAFFFRKEHPQRIKQESAVRPFDYPIRNLTHFSPEIREFSPAIAAARDHVPKAAAKLPSIEKEGARRHPQADNQTEETIYEKCLRLSHKKQFEDVITILLFYLLPYKKEGHALREHLKEVILLIHMYANQGELPPALECCAEALKHDKLDPALHYLHATILQALDDSPNAIKSLRRSLFLDSDFVVSHYMLGLLEQEKGNHKAAFRSFKTALELLDAYQAEDVLPGTDDLTAGRLKNILSARLEK